MWFEERSWSNNMKMSSLIVEEWRDLWSIKLDFLLAAFAYVFATTNLLNLPRLVLENGGLAFLAAYGAVLLICVLPIIVMELSVGQLTGRGPVQAFYNICPVFKGVGVAQVLFSLAVMAYMARYLAWLILYAFHLFWTIQADRPGLPWLHCRNFPELQTLPCREAGSIANLTYEHTKLATISAESSLTQFMTTLENPSDSIIEIGHFRFYLLAALGLVWILVFAAICFGVRWLGKVIDFVLLSAFALLVGLLCRALTLDGLWPILEHYYRATDWNRLLDYTLWKMAAEQAILATGIGFGAFITIGSYNKRSNNLVCDSLLIVIAHCILTAMQMLTVIGFVGFISSKTYLQPLEILNKGTSNSLRLLGSGENQMWHILAYMSYLPATKLLSGVVIFLSIAVLLNIFYLLSLTVLATLEDAFGEKWSRCFPRFVLALFVCAIGCALGLIFTTQAGRYAYELAKGYLQYVTLWAILTFEILAISWFYCAHRLGQDLREMLAKTLCWCFGHFLLFFTYLLPAIPIAIITLNLLNYDYDHYSSGVHAWKYSELVGWAIAIVPLLPIPICILFAICWTCARGPGITKCQRFKNAFRSPLRNGDSLKPSPIYGSAPPPRYSAAAPGYVLLPQAPLAEPEVYNETTGTELPRKN